MTEFSHFSPQKPRRQSQRIPGPFEARLIGDSVTPIAVRDINVAGCFVEAEGPIAAVAPIKLHVDLPGEGWIAVHAELVYRLGTYGVALKFIDLDGATRDRILREIERTLTHATSPAENEARSKLA